MKQCYPKSKNTLYANIKNSKYIHQNCGQSTTMVVYMDQTYTDKYFHIIMIHTFIEHMPIGFLQTMVVFIIKRLSSPCDN